MSDNIGTASLRSEIVDRTMKQIAKRLYKFKQAVTVSSTNAWKNTFWRETVTPLAGGTGAGIRGLPRGAEFPNATPSWDRFTAYIEKYGLQENIIWEDILTDEFDVQARVMYKITEGVVKSVDDQIFSVLTDGALTAALPTSVNNVTIAATKHWSGTSAAILDNVFNAAQLISEDNYSTDNLICFVSPKDKRSIMRWITDKGAQFNALANDVAINGSFAKVAGVTFVESTSVTASYALVCVPGICATWKEAVPFSTNTTEDPFKSVRIRAVEEGVLQLTDPGAACVIQNTQGTGVE